MARPKVLFDINVVLDVLMNREPHIRYAGPCLELALKRLIDGYFSTSTVDTLAFLLKKQNSAMQIHQTLEELFRFLELCTVNNAVIQRALTRKWSDIEDAILYETAVQNNCEILLTRNIRDFKVADDRVEVLHPEVFIKRYA